MTKADHAGLVERLRLIEAWKKPGGPMPKQNMPKIYPAIIEAREIIESIPALLDQATEEAAKVAEGYDDTAPDNPYSEAARVVAKAIRTLKSTSPDSAATLVDEIAYSLPSDRPLTVDEPLAKMRMGAPAPDALADVVEALDRVTEMYLAYEAATAKRPPRAELMEAAFDHFAGDEGCIEAWEDALAALAKVRTNVDGEKG